MTNYANKIGLLGSGTCRISDKNAQNSAYVKCSNSEMLIIDAGNSVPQRIAELNLLEGITTLHIHISHIHIDHLMGLFGLLQGIAWSDDMTDRGVKKVIIRTTNQVKLVFDKITEALGADQIGQYNIKSASGYELEFESFDNQSDWNFEINGIKFESVHLPDYFNHGLRFEFNGKNYGFTCDATRITPQLIDFLSNSDVAVFDYGHITNFWSEEKGWIYDHSGVLELASACQTPELIATHIYLRDQQDCRLNQLQRDEIIQERISVVNQLARGQGYRGIIKAGYDKMPIL